MILSDATKIRYQLLLYNEMGQDCIPDLPVLLGSSLCGGKNMDSEGLQS